MSDYQHITYTCHPNSFAAPSKERSAVAKHRIRPTPAFSRFTPIRSLTLEGQIRVNSTRSPSRWVASGICADLPFIGTILNGSQGSNSGPIARQRSPKPASALPPIGGRRITTNEQVRDAARSARPRSSPFTVSASGCLPRPVSGASGVAPSATERSQERLRGRNLESAPGLPLAHMNASRRVP